MEPDPQQVALIATHAGQVLLVRTATGGWALPRTPLRGGGVEATLAHLAADHRLELGALASLGTREVDGVVIAVHRAPIPGLPLVPGKELRLVRLSYLPKELGRPDRELLDALLPG